MVRSLRHANQFVTHQCFQRRSKPVTSSVTHQYGIDHRSNNLDCQETEQLRNAVQQTSFSCLHCSPDISTPSHLESQWELALATQHPQYFESHHIRNATATGDIMMQCGNNGSAWLGSPRTFHISIRCPTLWPVPRRVLPLLGVVHEQWPK